MNMAQYITAPAIHMRRCVVRRRTPSAHTLPLRRFHPFDYYVRTSQLPFDYSRNTVRRFRGYHSRDSADALDDSDCADALKQIHRYPLTIPRILFEDSADTLWWFRGYPLMIPRITFDDSTEILWRLRGNPAEIPQMICRKPTRRIRGYCKVSCDMYRTILATQTNWIVLAFKSTHVYYMPQ